MTGPAAPPSELAFLTALWEVWQELTVRGEAHLRARHDLDLRSYIALASIEAGVAGPAELARETGMPRYEVSRILRGLEARGAVTRSAQSSAQSPGALPSDGRRVSVTVTPAGSALCAGALDTIRALAGPPLSALGPDAGPLTRDLGRLARAVRVLPLRPDEPTDGPHPHEQESP